MRVRSVVALSVVVGLGGIGVAAAAVGGSDDGVGTPVSTSTVDATTPTSSPVDREVAGEEPSVDSSPVEASLDVQGTERSTEGCGDETYKNHGQYVRGVAQDPDREAGDVAAAAQSPCGKPLVAVGEETVEDRDDDTDEVTSGQQDDQPASKDPGPASTAPGRSGTSPGPGQGKAHGRP